LKKKLIQGLTVTLISVLLLTIGSQVVLFTLSKTSKKLIIEYHELHVLQEFKISLSHLLITASGFRDLPDEGWGQGLEMALGDAHYRFEICRQVLTPKHKGEIWDLLNRNLRVADSSIRTLRHIKHAKTPEIRKDLYRIIDQTIQGVNRLVAETQDEIDEYENRIRIISIHGTRSLLFIVVVLIIFLVIGGLSFIRNLTSPIISMAETASRIESGERSLRISENKVEEFQILAISFNNMLDALNKSSYSESYLRSIVNNLFGALFVTDSKGNIRTVNSTAYKLLQYNQEELDSKHISILFEQSLIQPDQNIDLDYYALILSKQKSIRCKDGTLIPVYITCTILTSENDTIEGLILVGHDESEKQAYEAKLEQARLERMMAIQDAQEEERSRIAIDIHDGLGQQLTAISYMLQEGNIHQKMEVEFAERLRNQLKTAILEAKNISHNLSPILLKDFGLIATIKNLVEKINQVNVILVRFNHYDIPDRLDSRLEKTLYRICQESLNNIIKHADAQNASVELFGNEEHIVMVIEDNGKGFDVAKQESQNHWKGIGLISMRERVTALGGVICINSEPGKGTEILIEIPLYQNTNHAKD